MLMLFQWEAEDEGEEETGRAGNCGETGRVALAPEGERRPRPVEGDTRVLALSSRGGRLSAPTRRPGLRPFAKRCDEVRREHRLRGCRATSPDRLTARSITMPFTMRSASMDC